jgi:predicted Zn finger-like uncharacterized protein
MSLITQCPACQTMFRVVPDQLRLSEGWVRCGQCDNVFDANAHFLNEPVTPAGAPPYAAAPLQERESVIEQAFAAEQDEHDAADDDALPPVDIRIDVDIERHGVEDDAVREPRFEVSDDGDHASAIPLVEELVVDPPVAAHASGAELDELFLHTGAGHQDQIDGGIALPPMAPVTPTFLHKPMPSVSVWRRTSVRVALSLVALALLMGLGAQVMVQERDRLAAMQPALKPMLVSACQVLLGCKVAPFRQIDGIVIDSSSFSKLRGDAYRLNLVVKNNSPTELAAPAIELTLTDLQDKPVLRRVFLGREFDTPAATLAAGADWTATLAVSVKPGGGVERITGYRVLAFYP